MQVPALAGAFTGLILYDALLINLDNLTHEKLPIRPIRKDEIVSESTVTRIIDYLQTLLLVSRKSFYLSKNGRNVSESTIGSNFPT